MHPRECLLVPYNEEKVLNLHCRLNEILIRSVFFHPPLFFLSPSPLSFFSLFFRGKGVEDMKTFDSFCLVRFLYFCMSFGSPIVLGCLTINTSVRRSELQSGIYILVSREFVRDLRNWLCSRVRGSKEGKWSSGVRRSRSSLLSSDSYRPSQGVTLIGLDLFYNGRPIPLRVTSSPGSEVGLGVTLKVDVLPLFYPSLLLSFLKQ